MSANSHQQVKCLQPTPMHVNKPEIFTLINFKSEMNSKIFEPMVIACWVSLNLKMSFKTRWESVNEAPYKNEKSVKKSEPLRAESSWRMD